MAAYYGYIIGFLAMCCYASLAPIAKKLTNDGLTSFYLIFLNSAFLFVFSTIALLYNNGNFEVLKKISLPTWGYITLWAFINFIGFALYIWAIGKIPVASYQIMYLATPIVGAILAYFLLSETIQTKQIVGGLIVAFGVYIAIRK